MGTFRKSLKLGKKSKQIEENLKILDKELKKTGALEETSKNPSVSVDENVKKFDWRKEFFPEKDQYEMINLLYEERQQKLKEAIGEEKIKIAEEVETLREAVERKRELRQLKRVDQHLANIDVEFYKLRDELVENINESMFPNIPAIEQKLDEILTVYGKLNSRISEGFLNEPTGSPQGGDPLAKTDFVTFDQLKQHYSLFLDRISTQLATLGGGGEVELKYLDDVVGIATNPSLYDGKYLKYDHATRKFVFSDVGPIGITTELQTLNNVLGLGNTSDLGMSVGVSTFAGSVVVGGATTALVVDGDVRVVGVLTVGSGTVTIDGTNNTIGIGTVTLNEVKVSQLDDLTGDTSNFTGDVRVAGVLTAISLDSSNVSVAGSVTATTFYGDGSQLTGLSVGVGTTTISTDSINVTGTTNTNELNVTGISTFQSNIYFPDNARAYFGTNGDLAIFYNSLSGNSVISGLNTGSLNINATTHFFKNQTGSETKAAFYSNGSVDLYYDDQRKFATTGTGVTVYGGISAASSITATTFYGDGSQLTGLTFSGGSTVFTGIVTFRTNATFDDNRKAVFGNSADLQIYHDGADSYVSEVGTGDLVLNSNGTNVNIKFNNTAFGAKFMDGGGSYIYHNNILKIETLGTGATTYGTHYASSFSGSGASLTGITTAQIVDFGNVVFGIGNSTNVNTTGVITATKFVGDGSALSGIATPGFVTQQIANLVDSAPGTLDTLNELAAALGDDPNFATTTANLISTKASLAGAAFTGSVSITNGNLSIGSTGLFASRLYAKERLYVGDNEDIRLYQVETGIPVVYTESFLDLGSTNNVGSIGIIKHGSRSGSYGGELQIQNSSGQKSAVFNSGWSGVDLYYNNNLKFSTTDSGAGVVGVLTATRFVGAATSNIMPFLYATYTDLPDAGTYHGAFAHVHSTGGAYYAHSGNWIRLVNYDVNEGNVSIGTANFGTSGTISAGIITATSAEFSNLRLGTYGLNNVYGVNGTLYLDSDFGQVDIVNNLNVNGVGTFVGRIIANDIVGLSSATFTGIVTAQAFVGDGSGLTGISASLALNDLTDVNAGSPSVGQVLKWSGSEWTAAADLTASGGSGIGLTDLSVTVNTPGISTLTYNDTTGVFTYTPPNLSSYLTSTITQNVTMSNGYIFTYDSSATAAFGSVGSNNYGQVFWGTSGITTGFHVENKDLDGGLYLTNTGTAGVFIRSTQTKIGASFIPSGEANLYYDNALKLGTIGVGASVYGNLHVSGSVNISGIVTAQEFKGIFTGVANYASVAGVASTANYATNALSAQTATQANNASTADSAVYATTAGIATLAQGLTGTPSINVGTINCTDDIVINGSTPTLKLQDTDNSQNYSYFQYDASAGPALLFRHRCFDNTNNFRWQSEAGGVVGSTDYINIVGGAPGGATEGFVGLWTNSPSERLDVTGSVRVTNNINVAGIITAVGGINAPLFVDESEDDDNYYNIPFLDVVGGGDAYRLIQVDNNGITFRPLDNLLTVSKISSSLIQATGIGFSGSGRNITGIPTAIVAGSGISIGSSTGVVTISATASGISTTETLVTAGINALGVVTATQFVGDGSGLTGIVASGTGVVIQDEGSSIGTAGTINFVGANVSSSLSGGTATVTVSNAYAQVAGVATVAQNVTGNPISQFNYIGVGLSPNPSYSLDIAGDVRLFGGDLWMPFGSTGSMVLENDGYVRNIYSTSGISLALQAFSMDGGVGIGTTDGHGGLFINSPTYVAGVVTATQFVGDGSLLTGIVASGTGITIQEEGSNIGTASTINFVGAAVTATISGGTATVSISAPAPVAGSKFIDNAAGIHTTSAVGIKTDLPKSDLQVGTFGMQSGIGTFVAAVGTPVVVDQFNISTNNFKTAEYTVHIQHANGMQTQKVLVMQDGTTSYSNEYAIMHSSADPLVSFASTISTGVCQLQVTPLTGTTGITTYRFSRGTLL